MPTSKQVRSAQERQKDKLAVLQAEKERQKRRRRFVGGGIIAVLCVALVVGAVVLNNNSDNSAVANSNPPTTPPTTAPLVLASVKGKPCVAMKGKPPAGQPTVPVQTGPPPTKLVTKDLKVGTGPVVTKDMTNVTVDYIGVSCSTGEVFDSGNFPGLNLKEPQVIQGWIDGIPGMKVGGTRVLGIPSDLAYKSVQKGDKIAPDEALWFVVTVKSAK
jgi:peptidylprolyl isomerase